MIFPPDAPTLTTGEILPVITAIGFGLQQFLQVVVDPFLSVAVGFLRRRKAPAPVPTPATGVSPLPSPMGENSPSTVTGVNLLSLGNPPPAGISDADIKKAVLGLFAFGMGLLIVSQTNEALFVLKTLKLGDVGRWDVFVSALVLGAGTEGANSVLKGLQYGKDALRAVAAEPTPKNSPTPKPT